MARTGILDPFAPQATEAPALAEIDKVFEREEGSPRLVSAAGEELPLPESVYRLLRTVVHLMASGRAIQLIPLNFELTTQEAADLLNVSRPHVVKLLEAGVLPFHKVGTHRRIRFEDLMTYKDEQDRVRADALAKMASLAQEDEAY